MNSKTADADALLTEAEAADFLKAICSYAPSVANSYCRPRIRSGRTRGALSTARYDYLDRSEYRFRFTCKDHGASVKSLDANPGAESLFERVARAKHRWLKRVMFDRVTNSSEKCFAYLVVDRLNCVTLDCWPSQTTIADQFGWSTKTVHRVADALERRGHLRIVRSTQGSYRYNVDRRPILQSSLPGDRDQGRLCRPRHPPLAGIHRRKGHARKRRRTFRYFVPEQSAEGRCPLITRPDFLMRGRRPKPTRIKALTGNPGKRPLNLHEPRPEPALPDCPPELSPAAQREWTRLTVELSKLNLITKLDRGALATYCGAYGMWAEAMEQIQKYGTMVKSPTGFPIQSPYLSIANRQAEIMMRIASEFGFTPASRSRISVPPPDQLPLFDGAPDEEG
jgi:P27 family predicted phage terminase small subunit